MLSRARSVLPADAELRVARLEDQLPDGPFDLIVSALAIHHLDAGGKAVYPIPAEINWAATEAMASGVEVVATLADYPEAASIYFVPQGGSSSTARPLQACASRCSSRTITTSARIIG